MRECRILWNRTVIWRVSTLTHSWSSHEYSWKTHLCYPFCCSQLNQKMETRDSAVPSLSEALITCSSKKQDAREAWEARNEARGRSSLPKTRTLSHPGPVFKLTIHGSVRYHNGMCSHHRNVKTKWHDVGGYIVTVTLELGPFCWPVKANVCQSSLVELY